MIDANLLNQHRQGSHDAFGELVHRHIDWVYGVARRRVGDAHLAEDVTQAAFTVLATKPPHIRQGKTLSAWLFGVVTLASKAALRTESRRRHRETEAAKMQAQTQAPQADPWEQLAPDLGEMVAGLKQSDRQAVLLRFYEQKSFAEVAAALGITDPAARKRVARAIDKLRTNLAGKGVTLPATALAGVLLSHVTTPAPAALAAAISAAPLAASAAGSVAALAKGVIAMMGATKVKLGVAVALLSLLLIATGVITATRHSSARGQTSKLSQPPNIVTPANSPAFDPPIALVDAEPTTRPAGISVDDFINRIKQTESTFKNVYVKNFSASVEERPAGEKQWRPTPRTYTGSAWYDNTPGGSARIFFSAKWTAWENGVSPPWVIETCDLSWDGHQGRWLLISAEYNGRHVRDGTAMLTAGRPFYMNNSLERDVTLIGFTLQYASDSGEFSSPPRPRRSLSALLEAVIMHILDWIIYRSDDKILLSSSLSNELTSDHFVLLCSLDLRIPDPPSIKTSFRNIKCIDRHQLASEINLKLASIVNPTADTLHH